MSIENRHVPWQVSLVNGGLFAICFFIVLMGAALIVVDILSFFRPVSGMTLPGGEVRTMYQKVVSTCIHVLITALGVTYFAVKIRLEKKATNRIADACNGRDKPE